MHSWITAEINTVKTFKMEEMEISLMSLYTRKILNTSHYLCDCMNYEYNFQGSCYSYDESGMIDGLINNSSLCIYILFFVHSRYHSTQQQFQPEPVPQYTQMVNALHYQQDVREYSVMNELSVHKDPAQINQLHQLPVQPQGMDHLTALSYTLTTCRCWQGWTQTVRGAGVKK